MQEGNEEARGAEANSRDAAAMQNQALQERMAQLKALPCFPTRVPLCLLHWSVL